MVDLNQDQLETSNQQNNKRVFDYKFNFLKLLQINLNL
jgi:hypothetical protein